MSQIRRKRFPRSLAGTWKPLELIGEGGMGQVVRCLHREEGFEAAVKVTRLPDDARQRRRTLREAQILRSLEHPGVVRVFDGGETDEGDAWLAMELLRGQTLDRGVRPADPWDFMLQAARALQAVHDQGLVHRDVKPANLLLGEGERAVLLDFGLVFDADLTRLTQTGHIAGTPVYLAPEILLGGDPTPRSDWFAWGVTLFWLVEGRLPFTWEDLQVHAIEDTPLPELRFAQIPPEDPRVDLLAHSLAAGEEERLGHLREIEAILDPASLPAPESREEPPSPPAPEPAPESDPADLSLPASAPRRAQTPAPPTAPSNRLPLGWNVFLPLVLLVALLWPSSPSEFPPPAPPPAPVSAPETAPTANLQPEVVTRARMARLRRLIEALTPVHPGRDRIFDCSGHALEIPQRMHDHVVPLLEEDDETFVHDFERLVEATRTWLVQLRDLHADHPEAPDPLLDPAIRPFLQEEVIPMLLHFVEDYLTTWIRAIDVRTALTMAGRTNAIARRLQAVLGTIQNLTFFLDDWDPLPRPLLPLRLVLPRDRTTPGYSPSPHLPRLQLRLEDPLDAQEYWLHATCLLQIMGYSTWIEDPPWSQRIETLQDLDLDLERRRELLRPRERALLYGRLLVEVGRLVRSKDLQPERLEELAGWYRRCRERLEQLADGDPALEFEALSSVDRMANATVATFYDERLLGEIMGPEHQRAVVTPLSSLRTRFAREGRLIGRIPSLDHPVPRW